VAEIANPCQGPSSHISGKVNIVKEENLDSPSPVTRKMLQNYNCKEFFFKEYAERYSLTAGTVVIILIWFVRK
jgi:hypothetical protein